MHKRFLGKKKSQGYIWTKHISPGRIFQNQIYLGETITLVTITTVTVMETVDILTLSDQVLRKIYPEKGGKFYGQRANKKKRSKSLKENLKENRGKELIMCSAGKDGNNWEWAWPKLLEHFPWNLYENKQNNSIELSSAVLIVCTKKTGINLLFLSVANCRLSVWKWKILATKSKIVLSWKSLQ